MAWYVVLVGNIDATQIGNVDAEVQQFANASEYKATTGASPTNVLPSGWQSANGFATKAQAQAVANRYNALPAGQRSTGGKVLAPSVARLPKLPNPLNALGIHGDFRQLALRVVEVILGGLLIIVALENVMKETGANNIVAAAKKYGKVVAK